MKVAVPGPQQASTLWGLSSLWAVNVPDGACVDQQGVFTQDVGQSTVDII